VELRKVNNKSFFNKERIVLLFSFICVLFFAKATYDEVLSDKNKQLDAVQKEIDETRTQIRDNSGELSEINKQTDSVEAAISTLDSFLKDYQDQTFLSADQIAIETNMVLFLADEVDKIQQSFKNKIVNLYKHGKNYELELLMSSKTPNEYLRRNQYLQKFSLSRKKDCVI
jgi:septal ring factor EnvC (AmiA/AmiB activator)